MLIFSNCLTNKADEGCLKLATSIVKRIKQKDENVFVISFERMFSLSDINLEINKFHINRQLISLIRKKKQPVLYIPFPAPSFSMSLRIWLLSLFARYGLRVIMVREYPMNRVARWLLRSSKAELVVFSKDAFDFFHLIVGDRIMYLKTGVDTEKFTPVTPAKVRELKVKYGFDPDKPLVLHVGHMKSGRNIAELMKIDSKYQILLVVSTLSKERQNQELKEKLLKCSNIRILDVYVPEIQEIYQMCDVYFFPVKQLGYCIDIPLSCLEAASCNKPVVTTDYGKMRAFIGCKGFVHIQNFNETTINDCIEYALRQSKENIRQQILLYDWTYAVNMLDSDLIV